MSDLTSPDIKLPCGLYRHYRGGIYYVLGIARSTDDPWDDYVISISLDATLPGPRMRAQSVDGWDGFNTRIDADTPRFVYVGHESPIANHTPQPPPTEEFIRLVSGLVKVCKNTHPTHGLRGHVAVSDVEYALSLLAGGPRP